MTDAIHDPLEPALAALVVLLWSPLLALIGVVVARSRGQSGLAVGWIALSGMWLGSCLFSWLLTQQLRLIADEGVAHALASVGCLAVGAAAVGWLAWTKPVVLAPSVRVRRFVAGGITVAVLASVWIVWRVSQPHIWPARAALPPGAEVIEEEALSDDFLGDFFYSMRARMDEDAYRDWMRALDAAPTEDPRRHGASPGDAACWGRGSFDGEVATYESGCM